jgi:hypothetical protein
MLLTMVTLLVAGLGSLHAAELLKTNLNRDDVAKTPHPASFDQILFTAHKGRTRHQCLSILRSPRSRVARREDSLSQKPCIHVGTTIASIFAPTSQVES